MVEDGEESYAANMCQVPKGGAFLKNCRWYAVSEKKAVEKEQQERIQGQWQRESPAEEYPEQVKILICTPRMMKQAFFALKGGEEY